MNFVNTNPESLRKLAQSLKSCGSALESEVQKLSSQLQSSQWNDANRRKFEDDLKEMRLQMSAFSASLSTSADYLQKKAQQLDDYNRS